MGKSSIGKSAIERIIAFHEKNPLVLRLLHKFHLLMEVIAAAAAVAANATKAVESAKCLALKQERGSSNLMCIKNVTGEDMKLREYCVLRGKAKMFLGPNIVDKGQDEAVFKSTGKLKPSGSSGIVTYELEGKTFLHIMWDCPYSRFKSENKFIGLFLNDQPGVQPNITLFMRMHQPIKYSASKQHFNYDLVCCSSEKGKLVGFDNISWGCGRPCEVENDEYRVSMTMGNSNHTTSKVTVQKK